MKRWKNVACALAILGCNALRSPAGEADVAVPAAQPAPVAQPVAAPVIMTAPGDCCADCAPACERGGVRGGIALYLLKPHWDNNPAYRAASAPGNGPGLATNDIDFDYDYHAAPALWLGYVGDGGFGARVRWFYFDQSAESLHPANDGTIGVRTAAPMGLNIDSPSFALGGAFVGQDQLSVESDLRMNVWDFEAMQELGSGRWNMLVSGGIRYAHLSENYNAFLLGNGANRGNTRVANATLLSGHNFNGAGPTAAFEVRRSIGDTNFAVYAMGRGSVLFGKSKQQADLLQVETQVGGGGAGVTTTHDSAHVENDKVISVAEIELGVDWTRSMGSTVLFAGFSVVGQSWFGAGNAANNDLIGNSGGNSDEIADNKAALGLFGFRISAGIGF